MNKPVIVFNLIMAVFYPMFFQLLIREKKKSIMICSIIYWIAVFLFRILIYQYSLPHEILFVLIVAASFIFLSLSTEMSLNSRIAYCSIPHLIAGVVNTILLVSLRVFVYQGYSFERLTAEHGTLVLGLTAALQFISFLISIRLLSGIQLNLERKDSLLILFGFSICNLLTIYFENVLFDESGYQYSLAMAVYLVSLTVAIIFYLMTSISRKNRNLLHEKYQNDLYSNQKILSMQTEQARNELYAIRHDLKHLVRLLSEKKMNIKNEEIRQVIRAYENMADQYPIPAQTPSEIINSAVNMKRFEAHEKGIDFKIIYSFRYPPAVADDDMYLILVNLLDNAIVHIGSGKRISVTIKDLDDYMGIRISNSVDYSNRKHSYLTRENWEPSHGFGISTVKQILAKYDGIAVFTIEDGEFLALLKIPNILNEEYNQKIQKAS